MERYTEGNTLMNEKEFLLKYTEEYLNDYPGPAEKTIDKFLQEHHKEYYEVEFIKKGYNCGFDEDGLPYHDVKCQGDCIKKESYADDPNPKLSIKEKNYYLDKENK